MWFPEPIGARECRTVTGATALLVDAFPDVARIGVQLGESPKRTSLRPRFGDEGEWGGGRGEVWSEWCVACVGAGEVSAKHEMRLRVPAGVREGTRFRFSVAPQGAPQTFVEVRITIR